MMKIVASASFLYKAIGVEDTDGTVYLYLTWKTKKSRHPTQGTNK
jgi:hypothetical protein